MGRPFSAPNFGDSGGASQGCRPSTLLSSPTQEELRRANALLRHAAEVLRRANALLRHVAEVLRRAAALLRHAAAVLRRANAARLTESRKNSSGG